MLDCHFPLIPEKVRLIKQDRKHHPYAKTVHFVLLGDFTGENDQSSWSIPTTTARLWDGMFRRTGCFGVSNVSDSLI